jgi:hypothetical protein
VCVAALSKSGVILLVRKRASLWGSLVRSVVVGEGFDGCGVVDRAVFPSWIGS